MQRPQLRKEEGPVAAAELEPGFDALLDCMTDHAGANAKLVIDCLAVYHSSCDAVPR